MHLLFCIYSIFAFIYRLYQMRDRRVEKGETNWFKRVKGDGTEFIHQEFSLTLVLRVPQSRSFLDRYNLKKCYMIFIHVYSQILFFPYLTTFGFLEMWCFVEQTWGKCLLPSLFDWNITIFFCYSIWIKMVLDFGIKNLGFSSLFATWLTFLWHIFLRMSRKSDTICESLL